MLQNGITQLMSGRQSTVAATSIRLFTVVVFASFFVLSGLSVKAVNTYSDSWLDDSNPNNGFIVGCGVTEANYDDDWELHSVRVTATLRSPNGRTATRTKYTWENGGAYSAHAEPQLAWDWNDVDGNYTVSSHHYSTCPATELGTTSLVSLVVLHAYRREEPSGEYVPTCDSSCTYYPRYIPIGVTAPYIQCGSIKNPLTGCGVGLCRDLSALGRCRG